MCSAPGCDFDIVALIPFEQRANLMQVYGKVRREYIVLCHGWIPRSCRRPLGHSLRWLACLRMSLGLSCAFPLTSFCKDCGTSTLEPECCPKLRKATWQASPYILEGARDVLCKLQCAFHMS